jgi:hypothetical protein
MTLFKTVLLLLSACASCLAQADFRFYVFDDVKNEKLDYTFVQDVTVYDSGSEDPRLNYYTEYRISGINQKEFSFASERFEGAIPRKEYAELMDRARKLPAKELQVTGKGSASGWIKVDGENHHVSASTDTEARKLWKAFIDDLLTKYAPAEKRKKSIKTIQGETVEPVPVSFPELLKNPKRFDGKRIRITGFYHGEFEGSSFASTAKDIRNYDKALWLGGDSSFADPKKVSRPNDSTLTVDGTFELGPGGHMGLWMGELSRVTEIKKVEQKVAQPATHSE